MKIDFIQVAWGERYRELLLNTALPHDLSPNNLGSCAGDPECRYRIFTTPNDAVAIRDHASVAALRKLIYVDIIEVADLGNGNKYLQMSRCHAQAISDARITGAALVFLSPDGLWSDGTFKRLRELIVVGVPLVVAATPRCIAPLFWRQRGSLSSPLGSRELVRLIQGSLSDRADQLDWSSWTFGVSQESGGQASIWPSHLYWRHPAGAGLLVHGFHLHPLMVRQTASDLDFVSVDSSQFIAQTCPDARDIYIVEDSDELVGCTLDSPDDPSRPRLLPVPKPREISDWAMQHAGSQQLVFFTRPIYFHEADMRHGQGTWLSTRQRAAVLVARVRVRHSLRTARVFVTRETSRVGVSSRSPTITLRRALSRDTPFLMRLTRYMAHQLPAWPKRLIARILHAAGYSLIRLDDPRLGNKSPVSGQD